VFGKTDPILLKTVFIKSKLIAVEKLFLVGFTCLSIFFFFPVFQSLLQARGTVEISTSPGAAVSAQRRKDPHPVNNPRLGPISSSL
jgi:hypothetical protein